MKPNQISFLLVSASLVLLMGCTKEEITEVTEVNNTYITGAEIYHWESTGEVKLLDVELSADSQGNQAWSWSSNNLIGSIEVLDLDSGDIIVAESQFRLRDEVGCESALNVLNGIFMSDQLLNLPSNSETIGIGTSGPSLSERWLSEDSFTFFHRTTSTELVEDWGDAHIGLWVNVLGNTTCQVNDGVRVQAANLVVTVYRNQ